MNQLVTINAQVPGACAFRGPTGWVFDPSISPAGENARRRGSPKAASPRPRKCLAGRSATTPSTPAAGRCRPATSCRGPYGRWCPPFCGLCQAVGKSSCSAQSAPDRERGRHNATSRRARRPGSLELEAIASILRKLLRALRIGLGLGRSPRRWCPSTTSARFKASASPPSLRAPASVGRNGTRTAVLLGPSEQAQFWSVASSVSYKPFRPRRRHVPPRRSRPGWRGRLKGRPWPRDPVGATRSSLLGLEGSRRNRADLDPAAHGSAISSNGALARP